MIDSRNMLLRKSKYLFGSILLLSLCAICAAFSFTGSDDFALAKREVLLRKIGHELLLQSGDSTSRVLPVKMIAANEYQISFENEFTFKTDALVNTTRRLLAKDPQAGDYIVNVLNKNKFGVAFGFAVAKNRKDDLVACTGRKQPKAAYVISIRFKPTYITTIKPEFLLCGLPLLAFLGFTFFKPVKSPPLLATEQSSGAISLGKTLFDTKNRKLVVNGTTLELTGTETRVLHVFALSPNETIARSRLQKEIWEDEGVIVGRSLDMFISKLRRKLELDPNINIVVIRGIGYKLEISA